MEPPPPSPSPLLAEAGRRWGVAADDLTPLGAFESLVFAERSGRRILKLTAFAHRGPDLIAAELDWVAALAEAGVEVARPHPSIDGRLVEVVEVGDERASATVFERAPGRRAGPGDWGPALFERWGALLGRLHQHARGYRPPPGRPRRFRWLDRNYLVNARGHIPREQQVVHRKLDALLARLRALPTPAHAFGLVHNDVHAGNFMLDGTRLTLFDFDDCAYNLFAYDLAMPLFYLLWEAGPEADREALTAAFVPPFLGGYRSVAPLDDLGLEHLPLFLETREAELYAVFHLKWSEAERGAERRPLLERIRRNLEDDVPVAPDALAGLLADAGR